MQRTVVRSLVLSSSLVCVSLAISPRSDAQTTAPSGPGESSQVQEREGPGSGASFQGEGSPRRFGRFNRGDGRFGGPGEQGGEPDPGMGPPPPDEERRVPGPFESGNEEWDKAMAFMKENSPKRAAIIADLPEDFQQRIREQMFFRYRMLERFRNSDKEMHDIALRRMGLEDELWALRMEVRFRGKALSPEDLSRVREKVIALIDLNLEERELRVQRLRDILRREEEILAHEKSQRDPAITENVNMIETGQRGGVLGGGGGGGGFGSPPRPGTPPTGSPPPPQPRPAP